MEKEGFPYAQSFLGTRNKNLNEARDNGVARTTGVSA